jgi:integrase
MSKYEKRDAFTLGKYWIAQREGSPSYYRFWYDEDLGRVCKSSLKTTDETEARDRLTAWFVSQKTGISDRQAILSLSECCLAYYEARGQHTCKPDSVKTSAAYALDYFGDVPADQVGEAEATAGFRDWLLEQGKSPGYTNRILGVLKAALMRSYKRRMIPHVPVVEMVHGAESEPLGRPMDVGELRSFYAAIHAEHVRRFFVLGLGTGARTGAILELDWSQVGENTIRLNPNGRKQTKKRRPVVPVCGVLGGYLSEWRYGQTMGPVVEFRGVQVDSIKTAWRATRRRAGLDKEVTAYSLRHTVASWLRGEGVNPSSVSYLMGHAWQGKSITERYAHASPDYMQDVKEALDRLLVQVVGFSTTQKLPSDFRVQT